MPATEELLQEGRYRIHQQHSHDGHGSVYEAYDTVRDANVVVKEILVRLNKVTTISQQENLKLAFANQAKLLTEIKHESLLHVHDFFSEIGRQYLVMEAVEGDDLAELLERNNSAFAVSDATNWADQLLDALTYLHTYQPPIIHRNIKPRNIKLNSVGRIKLLAFGLADGSDTKVTTTLSDDSADTVLNYSPLEQIWDGLDAASQKVIINSYDDRSERILMEPLDARSDIYSLGATLYHLLTARKPIDALERSIEILEGNDDPLQAPHHVNPNVPTEISDVIMRAMEIRREGRFDSAVIMRQVLRTAVVRVKERAEEEHDLAEAAEELRRIQQNRNQDAKNLAEQKRLEMEAEQQLQKELMEKQLREAEEQRLAAEAKLAETERLLREKEAAAEMAVNVFPPVRVELEDDLLQLNSEVHTSFDRPTNNDSSFADLGAELGFQNNAKTESPIHTSSPSSKPVEFVPEVAAPESEVRAFFDDSAQHLSVEPAIHLSVTDLQIDPTPSVEEIEVEAVKEVKVEPKASYAVDANDDIDFSHLGGKPGFSLGMPMIAGGIVVLLVVVIGAWMFMGSAEPPKTSTQESSASVPASDPNAQSAVPDAQQSIDPAQSASTETAPVEINAADSPAQVRTAQQAPAKPKKPTAEPNKAPTKKPVTVDDLIGDN